MLKYCFLTSTGRSELSLFTFTNLILEEETEYILSKFMDDTNLCETVNFL